MSEKKDSFEITPPIEVNSGQDADSVGQHYANSITLKQVMDI